MKQAFVIGIAGGTGSGKTTLAARLKEGFEDEIILLSQDNYYKSFDKLSFEKRTKLNYDHPDSFDTAFMIEQLRELKQFKPIERPVYSFVEHLRLKERITEEPRKVIIVEGILIFENQELMNLMDMKIFVDTDADLRFIRRMKRDIQERGRDVQSVIDQYLNTVRPMHEAFVEPSKKKADIIVPMGGMNEAVLSILTDKIKGILRESKE
ncbi:uridine kinase [Clostridium oryzae]|uniref:Uridine kinase n=1 Tax=Clostridium oryzae TaxID=1450648 RepID=A0A1V4ILQ2_9CLOT|nr:uridine kinase [Clostridium oryzae]OPJ60856.1 uridine kinase [Clostridium oryzae]